ncbi:PIR protein [Plasmodium vivax]|uniref:VIR protein n=1 Tax=Plasmodium vivax TaxID=5855 RepID=A0A565A654_PLAVI|nr:PIR protein [Plasmodium vivax]
MSEISMDIAKWKSEYPFLENVWKMYEDFEKKVSDDENASMYIEPICINILRILRSYNINNFKEFCMKLVRNLGAYSNDPIIYNPNRVRCKNLNNWLYYLIMKHKIPDDIISKIFQESKNIMDVAGNKNMCPYNTYSEFLDEPDEMLKINHFDDNINKIKGILMDNEHTNNCSCRRYIYDCARMYNEMNRKYCSTDDNRENKYKTTCSQLYIFKYSYDTYLTTIDLINKIPPLDNHPVEQYVNCPSSKSDKELVDVKSEQGSSSTSSTLPTAIGTMAGVSSVLAFLYKFTPAGNLLHSGLRGNIGSIKNTMYSEDANALIFDRLEHSDYNSYNIGYEAT